MLSYSPIHISIFEEDAVNRWLKTRKVQKLLKNGGSWALVFNRSSGIGVAVTATVMDVDGNVLSKDITDYETW